jgi:hypothetical protein
MEPGAFPGWFNCRKCKLWVDIQEWNNGSSGVLLSYYDYCDGQSISKSTLVPEGTLLVLESELV